jgi:predicted Holliday junction resolvase-like endonuclease
MYLSEAAPSDFLSKLEMEVVNLEKGINSAEELISKKRSELVAKESKTAELQVNKRVNKLIPGLSAADSTSKDLKTIGYPVKFISFEGKQSKNVSKMKLIDYEATSANQESIHSSITKAIEAGNLEWKTLRVEEDGRLTEE